MTDLVLIIIFLNGLLIFFTSIKFGRYLFFSSGIMHLIMTIALILNSQNIYFNSYLKCTYEGLVILSIISFLFLCIIFYSISYLKEIQLSNERIFTGSMVLFLSAMTLVSLSDNIILIWVAIEATTLSSAPLIFIHKSKKSLEATWKYILICSVGIALALLGSFFVVLSMDIKGINCPLTYTDFSNIANLLDKKLLKAAFIFILVGYGTKMGLAPMHTWLPDAHSEAPGPASALLSGALLNCAFLAIYKTNKILILAGLGNFSNKLLIIFGIISIFIAATFALKQSDYKRLLAYSSIENMGIIAFGTGVGGLAAYGAILHLIHHSLIKSSLFLTSQNYLFAYGSKLIDKVGNGIKLMPKSSILFIAGFFGISGFPPFGIFLSEFLIIMGTLKQGLYSVAIIFIMLLIIVFAGFAKYFIRIIFNNYDGNIKIPENFQRLLPQYILLAVSIILTFFTFDFINSYISNIQIYSEVLHG